MSQFNSTIAGNVTDAFNEGVGHGGFIATVHQTGGQDILNVIFDPFDVDPQTEVIRQPDQYGTAFKKQGRLVNRTATATAQLPITEQAGQIVPVPLVEGMYLTDPLTGKNWWISHAPQAYRSGEFWKQNVTLEEKLNAGL